VPWLWLIWPENPALIAHELDGHSYQVIATLKEPEQGRARIPPVDAVELTLDQVLRGRQ
jgi:hypothetical protein